MNELFRLAESHETAARVTIASGSAVFHTAVRNLSVTKAILAWGSENNEAQQAIASRIADLVEERIDLRYRHPHDIPLAIYLWILYYLNRNLSRLAAGVLLQARNCAWAHRMANAIRQETDNDLETTSFAPHVSIPIPMGTAEVRIETSDLRTLRSCARGRWSVTYPTDDVGTYLETGTPRRSAKTEAMFTRASIAA